MSHSLAAIVPVWLVGARRRSLDELAVLRTRPDERRRGGRARNACYARGIVEKPAAT